MDWRWFVVALIFFVLNTIVKAFRWNRIKADQNINYSLKDSILMYYSAIYIGALTPGRLGEFVKILYLRSDNHRTGSALFNTILDRLYDLGFLCLVGCAGLFIFGSYVTSNATYLILFFILLVLGAAVFFWKRSMFKRLFLRIVDFIIPKKRAASFRVNTEHFFSQFELISPAKYLLYGFYTLISWLLYYLMLFAAAKGLGMDISFWVLSIVVSLAALVTLLPVSISGIGTRDVIFLLILGTLGVAKEVIIAFSLSVLLLLLLSTAIGFVCWLFKPINVDNGKKKKVKRKSNKVSFRKHPRKYIKKNWVMIVLILLTLFTFGSRVANTSDLSGGDDSQWSELAMYSIANPRLMVYPQFPDEPIPWQNKHYSRPATVIVYAMSILIFGFTKFAVVFPSALFSALSIILLFLLVRKFFNTNVALLASFLLAVSPFHLAFTRIGILDASLIFYCLLSYWLLITSFETKKARYIYLSALVWLVNITTTDIRGTVPILAVLPCFYFYLFKKKLNFKTIRDTFFKNRLFHAFLISHIGIIILFLIYITVPLLWGDSGWLETLKVLAVHSVGARAGSSYMGFFEAIHSMGSILIFTPFLGTIFVPFLAGLAIAIRNIKEFRYSFWIFFMAGIVFFYSQGQFAPHRQTIFLPTIVIFAAVGLLLPYIRFKNKGISWQLPLVLAASFSYLFFFVFMFSLLYPGDFVGVLSAASSVGASALLTLTISYWYVFVVILCVVFAMLYYFSRGLPVLFSLRSTKKKQIRKGIRKIYLFAIFIFLVINLVLALLLVQSGVGIYKRTSATSEVGLYLKDNLVDEKFSCVAGVHAKSFAFYTQRPCATWLRVNVTWLEEQASAREVSYFIFNTHYDKKTVGVGNTLPDGTLGPALGDVSDENAWVLNYEDVYNWVQDNAEDVSAELGMGAGRYYRVYKYAGHIS